MSSKDHIPSMERMSNAASSGLEYEVFLSFRGPDTRYGFTDFLYTGLTNAGIRVYRDDEELRIGEEISSGLREGIKGSKIAIPIFSKGYTSSKWCLKELTEITKWKQSAGLKVMPIFYYVTPSEVRNQTGDYEKVFESHKKDYDEKTIQEWREALRENAQLKGWEIQIDKNRQEGKLVEEVIRVVLRELKKSYTIVTDYLIGVDHHVEAILNMVAVESNDVRIVGIHGMGGIGKTTIAKVIYNHLLPRYESYSFLADVRENSLTKGIEFLQKKMISDILKREWSDITSIDDGITIISERFVNKKVLVLLDDIDKTSQFKELIGKRKYFGLGSTIIITTRDKGILDSVEANWSYELSCMGSQDALQLFNRHAFRSERPPKEYALLSQKAIEMTAGLPLALEVIGSLLYGKGKEAWDYNLKKLEKVPNVEVGKKLKISFDSLDDPQKQIFLDIACFFIGASIRITIHFWNDGKHFPEEAIEMLQQLSLIKIQKDDSIWMHDQVRDMGRDIVRQEHITEPEKRGRLWNPEEATDFLMRKMGYENVGGICLNLSHEVPPHFPSKELALLPNLRFLHVRGDLKHPYVGNVFSRAVSSIFFYISSSFCYKSPPIFSELRWLSWEYLPTTYDLKNLSLEDLVILNLRCSRIRSGWSGWRYVKMAKNLRVLNLTGCDGLVKTPDVSYHPLLEQLILEDCNGLVEIDESISMLKHLVIINLGYCTSLRKLPKELSCLESLEELSLRHAYNIVEIPDWPGMKRLRVLDASLCYKLNKVGSLNFAVSLLKLSLSYCWELQALPESIGNLLSLEELDISRSGIVELPQSIGNLTSLKKLNLSGTEIVKLPDTIGNLKNLNALIVYGTHMRELPASIRLMENLLSLDARQSYLISLPKCPPSLISLEVFDVKLQTIPDLSNLIHLRNLELEAMGPLDPFEAGSPALWWIGRLTNLERLKLKLPQVLTLSADLVVLSQLKELTIHGCENVGCIPELPPSLTKLEIERCKSLGTLLNLPPSVTRLDVESCNSLRTLPDLPSGLTELRVSVCSSLRTLPDLSHMRRLDILQIIGCPSINKLEGLRSCKPLRELVIEGCDIF